MSDRCRGLLVFLFFLLLAVAETWPLVQHGSPRIPENLGDPALTSSMLAWDTHALATSPRHLFDAGIFYPVDGSLAFSEHVLGVWRLFLPATWRPEIRWRASTRALLSFTLTAFASFCLARRLTGAF